MTIYLDNAATSFPKPEAVYAKADAFARTTAANPERGDYGLARQAEATIDETRHLLARLFAAPQPERIIFAFNATDALSMAIRGVLRTGDHVITSVLEHNSVSRPLERLARDGRISLTRLPATVDLQIDPDAVVAA